MQTIVLYTSGTLGDHLPFLALGQGLRSRGYRVRMAVNPALHEHVQRAGLEATSLPETPMGPSQAQQYAHHWNHWQAANTPAAHTDFTGVLDAYSNECYLPMLRALRDLCQDADLLLATSIRPWGWVIHEAIGIPWLTISVCPDQFAMSEPVEPSPDKDTDTIQREFRQYCEVWLQNILLDLGHAKKPAISNRPCWSDDVILASSRHFSPSCSEVFPCPVEAVHMSGFWFYDDPAWRDWEPEPALLRFVERQPIVLSFSSLSLVNPRDVLMVHLQAAAQINRPLLVQAGWAGFSASLLPHTLLTSDVMFVDFIPHDWLFQRAACTIQHGGIGSIARALRQGCPLLIEPYAHDQFFNAMRITDLQVGTAVHPGKLTADGLAQILSEKVLSSSCRQRAEAIGASIHMESGVTTACDQIEQLMRRPQPHHPTLLPSGV